MAFGGDVEARLVGLLRSDGSVITSLVALDADAGQIDVPYILQNDGSINTRVVLEDAQGRRVEEQVDQASGLAHRGLLTPGTYTLAAQAGDGSLDVRFTVGAADAARPRCIIEMTAASYRVGDVVSASRLEVANQQAAVPVELKIWLRLPDGHEVPAHNAGADGTVTVPAATSQNFGPLDVMGVDDNLQRGLYEFGCRLLNPITGEQLDEDSDLFEVR